MSGPTCDEQARFSEKMREQDIPKTFEFKATADEPYLSVSEVQAALGEPVLYRALVGPKPAATIDWEIDHDGFVSLGER